MALTIILFPIVRPSLSISNRPLCDSPLTTNKETGWRERPPQSPLALALAAMSLVDEMYPAQPLLEPRQPSYNLTRRRYTDRGRLVKGCAHPCELRADCCLLYQSPSVLQVLDDWEFLIAPLIFTAFAVFTRLWKIGLSPIVTWDVSPNHVPASFIALC